jgi:hypothetical protein
VSIFGRFRMRASGRASAHDSPPPGPSDGLAIVHYDRLSEKKVIAQLAHLSRVELADVEEYERSHRARPAVLERLHYALLGGVDAATAKAVGDFERSAQRRRGAQSSALDERDALRQEARYHRERLELYRAKTYGGRGLSEAKLRELQRAADGAAARLERAEAAERAAAVADRGELRPPPPQDG